MRLRPAATSWSRRREPTCLAILVGFLGGGGCLGRLDAALDVGEVHVIDDFVHGEELTRVGQLLAEPVPGRANDLNATYQKFKPKQRDESFFLALIQRITRYAEEHVHPVPDDSELYPFKGEYFIDYWELRRYVTEQPEHRRVFPHTDTEQPGRCLSSTLYLGDDTLTKGGTLQTFRCPRNVNCRRLIGSEAYEPFFNEEGLQLTQEVSYKRGRLVFFLSGTPHAVTELLRGPRDILFIWLGCYPTLRAAANGHVSLVTQLLEARASVDGGLARGFTPLHRVVGKGHKAVASLLLNSRANVQAQDDDLRRTPLFLAAQIGHADIVDELVAWRANVCTPNSKGESPLDVAMRTRRAAVVDRLIASGGASCADDRKGARKRSKARRRRGQRPEL